MHKTRLAASTALALLACAAPAHADSIAYVKGGDLWLSTPDGARQYQVTDTGGYSTVSQDDTGVMAALHGDHIRTVDRTGTVLHDIRTPASSSFPGTQFRGPFDPAISPNGLKIAYTWYWTDRWDTPSCNPSTGCQNTYSRQGTGYTDPTRITGFDEPGFKAQTGWVGPSWSEDNGTILSDPAVPLNEQVILHTPGDVDRPTAFWRWFDDPEANGLRDVERSPDKHKLAGVSGDKNDSIRFYRADGNHKGTVWGCYALDGAVGRYESPSWSPDSKRLAYSDGQGIHTIAIPATATECGQPTEDSKLLIPGASYPDWGPADVPPARTLPSKGGSATDAPAAGPGTTGGGTGTGAGTGQAGSTAGAARIATVRVARATRAALRKGLVVRVVTTGAGRVTATLRRKRQTVASGVATATGAGTVSLRVAKVGRRKAARLRGARLTLRVTVGADARTQAIRVR